MEREAIGSCSNYEINLIFCGANVTYQFKPAVIKPLLLMLSPFYESLTLKT